MSTLLNIEIQDTHKELFRRTIEYLLANTFILKSREENLYKYLSNTSNMTNINCYLEMLGYTVYTNAQMGIAMLQTVNKDDDPARDTTLKLKSHYSRALIIIAKTYMEKFFSGEETISITMRELTDQLAAYKIKGPSNEKNWVENALNIFRQYSLVDFNLKDTTEDRVIFIHDSIRLLLGEHIDQFKENVNRYINIFNNEDISEDDPNDYEDIEQVDYTEE